MANDLLVWKSDGFGLVRPGAEARLRERHYQVLAVDTEDGQELLLVPGLRPEHAAQVAGLVRLVRPGEPPPAGEHRVKPQSYVQALMVEAARRRVSPTG